MRLFLVRHAEPDYGPDTITPAGHLEAAALAERFAKMGLDTIYSSPCGRALDTMRYTAEKLGKDYEVLEWTREIENWKVPHEGKERCVWEAHEDAELAGEYYGHGDWWRKPPFDNPLFKRQYDMIAANSDALLARHGYVREGRRYRVVRGNKNRVAVFCHGALGLLWLAHLLELPVPHARINMFWATSSVTTVLLEERREGWACPRAMAISDVSHLYAAGLPVSPMGTRTNVE